MEEVEEDADDMFVGDTVDDRGDDAGANAHDSRGDDDINFNREVIAPSY